MHRSSIVNLFQPGSEPSYKDDPNSDQDDGEAVGDCSPEVPVSIGPRYHEQAALLTFALDMRNEAAFCDITFVVKGSIFRAHRIIVSAWSRWLRALLSEGDDDAITFESFEPFAFGAVLDYMYGQPLLFSTENADDILKIVRRLELRALEQECWKHLMSVVNVSNCKALHELADRFDCPPLKLTSWHIIQESKLGYGTNPSNKLFVAAGDAVLLDHNGVKMVPPPLPFTLKGSGLTGPGEIDGGGGSYYANGEKSYGHGSDDDEYLSVFNDYTEEFRAAKGGDSSYSDEQEQLFPFPEQLPPGAPAADVIKAWAYKLQLVYDMCMPGEDVRQQKDRVQSSSHFDQQSSVLHPQDNTSLSGSRHHHRSSPPAFSAQKNLDSGYDDCGDDLDTQHDKTRQKIIEYYNSHGLLEKITSVDNILANFKYREDLIFEALRKKYDDPDSADYIPPTRNGFVGKKAAPPADMDRDNKQKGFFGIFS